MVTAFDRVEQTIATLDRLAACRPAPAEILVHVDGGQAGVRDRLQAAHPASVVMMSATRVGPGGGRNRLAAAATQPIVASFDDDSFPMDEDYFARLVDVFSRTPDADVVAATLFHRGEPVQSADRRAAWVADFVAAGCAYRRDAYARVGGYVPLVVAYNMEEVDFALRLHALGGKVLSTPWLRVFHDTDLSHHAQPSVTAASVTNLALLAYLRYPASLWPSAGLQIAKRVGWLVTHGRRRGVLRGLADIPSAAARHRSQRDPLPAPAVRSYWRLRRSPVPVPSL